MKKIGAFAPFIVIAGLLVFAIFGGRLIGGSHASQSGALSDKQYASLKLTSIMSDPYRVNIPVDVSSSNLTIKAMHSQNGSASGALKVITNNLTFKSNNEQVAVVNGGGRITGISPGTTTITVTYSEGNVTKTCDVAVTITAAQGT